jgi:S-formylglutathione hydrolase FrmB
VRAFWRNCCQLLRSVTSKRCVATAFLALGFVLFSPAQPGAAAHPTPDGPRGQCLSLHSRILGRQVAYCILRPPSYDVDKTRRYPVLYYFHGLGDNEQMFLHSDGWNRIEDLWDGHQIGEFLIVTPAAGSTFYINSLDGRVRYDDFLLQEFLPYIENHYRIRAGRANHGVAGFSMGGYGALRTYSHP